MCAKFPALGLGVCTFALTLLPLTLSPASAHPVPRCCHDRTLVVRLTAAAAVVDYHLEVDQWTVLNIDLKAFEDKIDFSQLTTEEAVYETFARCYAPVLADNFIAELDGKALAFTCVKHAPVVLPDSFGWDFRFQATWKPATGRQHRFIFKEANYIEQAGLVKLALTSGPPVALIDLTAPSEALKSRPAADLQQEDEEKLRTVAATFEVSAPVAAAKTRLEPEPPSTTAARERSPSLLRLLLDTKRGFWLLLFLAACFGAAHALTPGHGKTLVAAYLVGENGTVWHACVLGLVTTLTHTGAVLALAAVLRMFFPDAVPADLQILLGAGGGLLVAGLGLWLLLKRLAGGQDHIHTGGHDQHHDHHPHAHADHYHDEQGEIHRLPQSAERVSTWGLVLLGMSGGIIPCWDAIIMLGFAISAHRLWLALPLLLAFSTGLAGVLILIGIGVVYAKSFASSQWRESRLLRALPLASAAVVTVLGLWLCYTSIHRGV